MKGVPVKNTVAVILISAIVLIMFGCNAGGDGKAVSLETKKDSLSYALGSDMGRSVLQIKDEIDIDILMHAVRAHFEEQPAQIERAAAQQLVREFSMQMRKKQQEESQMAAVTNKEEGEKFLEENGKKEGVVTTASGLQYTVLEQGDGPKPKSTDQVTVHYRGTTIDGTEFDSSHGRGQPATFGVTGVIKGWTEALQLMNVGSKYKLFIPSELAYGQRGAGQNIGPNAVLIFEVELLEIAQ
jgi:FKBP-type peptidyl-prolyl cis-trans isomerase